MSIFVWRALAFVGLLYAAFIVATITVTLIVIKDVENEIPTNTQEVVFVEAANYVHAAILFLILLSVTCATPIVMYYRKNTQDALATGLKRAF